MRTDLYTKSILTIIAVALLWLCAQNALSPKVALAQPSDQRVILAGYLDSSGKQRPVTEYGLPVAIWSPLETQPASQGTLRTSKSK